MSQPDRPLAPGGEAPVFAEPWQAEAFALVVHLNQVGAFTWSEWTEALSREIAAAGDQGTGNATTNTGSPLSKGWRSTGASPGCPPWRRASRRGPRPIGEHRTVSRSVCREPRVVAAGPPRPAAPLPAGAQPHHHRLPGLVHRAGLHRSGNGRAAGLARQRSSPSRLRHRGCRPRRRPLAPLPAHLAGVRLQDASGGWRDTHLRLCAGLAKSRTRPAAQPRVHSAGMVPRGAAVRDADGRLRVAAGRCG